MGVNVIALSASGSARQSANVAGDATFTDLATLTIPANRLRPGDMLTIRSGWLCTASANGKSYRVVVGGTNVRNVAITANNGSANDFVDVLIQSPALARSVPSAPVGNPFSQSTSGIASLALDITQPITVSLQAAWSGATASEFIENAYHLVQIVSRDN